MISHRFRENLHIECEFELSIGVRIVHLEEAVDELF